MITDINIFIKIAKHDENIWRTFSMISKTLSKTFNSQSIMERFPLTRFPIWRRYTTHNYGDGNVCYCGRYTKINILAYFADSLLEYHLKNDIRRTHTFLNPEAPQYKIQYSDLNSIKIETGKPIKKFIAATRNTYNTQRPRVSKSPKVLKMPKNSKWRNKH